MAEIATDYARLFAEVREEWLKVGLSTEPADRHAAESGIRLAYRAVGLPEPEIFLWEQSPHAAARLLLPFFVCRVHPEERSTLGRKVWEEIVPAVRILAEQHIRDLLRTRVGQEWQPWPEDSVSWPQGPIRKVFPFDPDLSPLIPNRRRSRIEQVTRSTSPDRRKNLWMAIFQPLEELWPPVWTGVWIDVLRWLSWHPSLSVWLARWNDLGRAWERSVREGLSSRHSDDAWGPAWKKVGEQARDEAELSATGQHDLTWVAGLDALRRLGEDVPPGTDGLILVAQSCGWWWPCGSVVVCTERPCRLERDSEGRLHSSEGMALQYPDGWGFWRIHGVEVNERTVLRPESYTPKEILNEENAEVRRTILERYGWDRFIQELGAKPIDNDEYGTLYRVRLPNDEPLVMVHVVNSTPEPDGSFREFFIRVPPTMRKARQAVAWTFGLDAVDYQPEAQS